MAVVPAPPVGLAKVAAPQPRTVGITVDPNADPYRGVLAACPQGEPARTQPDWYMPGYRSIGLRLCDGQWVTCGNRYPCAEPTVKGDGTTGYGYAPDVGLGESGGYNYYAPPPGWQQGKPKGHTRP